MNQKSVHVNIEVFLITEKCLRQRCTQEVQKKQLSPFKFQNQDFFSEKT